MSPGSMGLKLGPPLIAWQATPNTKESTVQQEQTVGVFLDFPVVREDGRIDRIYPRANFSELISQVRRCELGHLKMVGSSWLLMP